MSDLSLINTLVKTYLGSLTDKDVLNTWTIGVSKLNGRGLIANTNISQGSVIFVDHPLIKGPRASKDVNVGCVSCFSTTKHLKLCLMGCGLLVCSTECQNISSHQKECAVILSWNVTNKRENLDPISFVRNIVPLRALLLDKTHKQILLQLSAHVFPKHGGEVRFMQRYFEIPVDDEILMLKACRALDTNAYEMNALTDSNESINLRGLFPAAALLNHACSPNTRQEFDIQGNMYLRATSEIPADTEICTSYTGLLWGTTVRRQHLMVTKHFSCNCQRCSDKTEFGTYLNGLCCLDKSCSGILLPINSLESSSDWCCEECNLNAGASQIGVLQSVLAGFLGSINPTIPDEIYDFIGSNLKKFLPESNHIVIELKKRIISMLGTTEGYSFNELSAEWESRAERLCREVLRPCALLGLGRTQQAARVRLALHRILCRRLAAMYAVNPERSSSYEMLDLEKEVVDSINECCEVLKYDLSAPKDLELRRNLANFDVRKLIDYDIKL